MELSDWIIAVVAETMDFLVLVGFVWLFGFFFFLFLEDSRLYPFAYLRLRLSDVLMKHIVVQKLLSSIPCLASYPVYNLI